MGNCLTLTNNFKVPLSFASLGNVVCSLINGKKKTNDNKLIKIS